jgi:hypothetical protein
MVLSLFIPHLVVASNIVLLLSFILSGYFCFLLVDYLVHNKPAAFLAGVVFAFCPYRFAHLLGHFDLTSTHWIPLFILFFLKMAAPVGSYRPAVIAGAIAVFTMLDAYYYSIFLIIFMVLFYLYKLCHPDQRREYISWRGLRKVAVLGLSSLLFSAPFLVMAYKHARAAGFQGKTPGWLGANDFVGDVTAFFIPSFLHPFWQPRVQAYYDKVLGATSDPVESVVFIGWLVVLLTLFACLYLARQRPALRIWRFLAVAFLILSLGPTLHIKGKYLFDLDGLVVSVPLPYILVHYIPLVSNTRCPARLNIMFMLCAAILSAYAWIWIQEKLQQRKQVPGIALVLLGLIIIFEYLSVPIHLCSAKIPVVFQKIASDTDPGTVLELPVSINDGAIARGYIHLEPFMMYAQTVHNKKRIGGSIGRGVQMICEYFDGFPAIRHLFDLLEDEKHERVISAEELEEDKKTVADLIRHFSFKYIVVHPEFKDSPAHRYVSAIFNLAGPTYQDEGYLVYRISENSAQSFTKAK